MPQPVEIKSSTLRLVSAPAFTRPADTTAYASGDLVANSTTAGSVVALVFPLPHESGAPGEVLGARLMKSTNSATNAAFRMHLFTIVPTFATNGDNDAISTNTVATSKGWLGYCDITAMTGFSAVAWGAGAVDTARLRMPFVPVASALYGIIEARGAYTPGSEEVFTPWLLVR